MPPWGQRSWARHNGKAMEKRRILLHPTPPFDFGLTAENQPYFRKGAAEDADSGGVYQRLLDLGDRLVLATAWPEGSVDRPAVAAEIAGDGLTAAAVDGAQEQLARLLGMAQDAMPFYAMAAADPILDGLVARFYGMHLPRAASVFEALTQAILGQQLAASVARVIRALLLETYGTRGSFDGQEYYAFPRPEAIAGASLADLRKLKLSQRKAEYLQGIAREELARPGGLDAALAGLADEAAARELTALRGVGQWSAEWVLTRALGRDDAFPVGDLALRRIVSRLYFGGAALTDGELAEFSRRWMPYRSWATHYLFAALRAGVGG